VHRDIMPGMRSAAEGLFVPLFFASAGLQFDLSFTAIPAPTLVALVLIPLAGKFVGAFLGTYLTRLDAPVTLATGLMSKGVAEIALLLVLLESGVIGQDVFSLFALIMFGYILLMPPVIDFTIKRAKSRARAAPAPAVSPSYARYALDGVKVSSVLDRTRDYPQPSTSVQSFMDKWTVPNHADYVVADDGAVAGTVSLARLHALPRDKWGATPLRDVMRLNLPWAWPNELISDVLERMAASSIAVIPVTDRESGKFLGTVASHDILDLVLLMDEINKEEAKLLGKSKA
jgi:CBS domain-containing protein